jgi:hypothetical protein
VTRPRPRRRPAILIALALLLVPGLASAASPDSTTAAAPTDSVRESAPDSTVATVRDLDAADSSAIQARADSLTRFGPRLAPDRLGPYYFYRPVPYGSAQLINPIRMILNGGYGIMQVGGRDNHVFETDYQNGWRNLWKNMADPVTAIEQEGWGVFARGEIIPFTTSARGARYWPNYTQHLIGGGMGYRMMQEWYRAHSFEHPGWWAVSTLAVYHVLNETIETSDYTGWTTDPVADLYIFDPAGVIMFSFDGVAKLFGEKLHMTDWSYQPAYNPWDKTIENIGQNYVLKYPFPGSQRWYLMYHWGTHGEMGVSYWQADGDCFSIAGGFMAGKLVNLQDGIRTVDLVPSAGVFWDRHNSLLVSLLYANTQAYKARLNVYPGLVRLGFWSPGFFVAVNRNERIEGGITFSTRFPVGLSIKGH